MTEYDERKRAREGDLFCEHYSEALRTSEQFRKDYRSRLNVVKSNEMPFEHSPDGLIKHIINKQLDTKECCIDAYMHFLKPGESSGKHRHLSEEVCYVVEGAGYDLHWDLKFDCKEEFVWEWLEEPKKIEWQQGDFVYVPPYSIHQHFNPDSQVDARLIVITNRIIKDMGFDWFEQVENAAGF